MFHWGDVRERALLDAAAPAHGAYGGAHSAYGGAHGAYGGACGTYAGAGVGAGAAAAGPASSGAGAAHASVVIPGAALGGGPVQRGAAVAKLAYGDTLGEHAVLLASECFWHGKGGHATAACGVLLGKSVYHGRAAGCWPVVPGATGLTESKAQALQRLTASRRK